MEMEASSSANAPARSSPRPIPRPLPSSLMDKFLGTSLPPASAQFPSSDASIAADLDDMDEQDIWGIDTSGSPVGDGGKGGQQAPLPPRMISASRRLSAGIDGRIPLRDGSSTPWSASTVNSLSSISGTLPGSSPLGTGSRNIAARILSSDATARRAPAASRMIPRMSQHYSEASSSSNMRMPAMPQSAPLNIPLWSGSERRNHVSHAKVPDDDEDEDEDEDEERLPPHEIVAREYARSQKTSFSVLEGAGRTLKGRDLSRVRNAILTHTGFVEKTF